MIDGSARKLLRSNGVFARDSRSAALSVSSEEEQSCDVLHISELD